MQYSFKMQYILLNQKWALFVPLSADGSPVVLDWHWAADLPGLRERRFLQELSRQEGIRPAGNTDSARAPAVERHFWQCFDVLAPCKSLKRTSPSRCSHGC